MNDFLPKSIYSQRPLQARSFAAQKIELGLDPLHKSPPEAELGYALLSLMLSPEEFGPPNYANLFLPAGEVKSLRKMPPIQGRRLGVINVAPGFWVEKYQSDYLLEVKAPNSTYVARGALECDGHNYHDRSLEQAVHDRKRDRDFQKSGFLVLRFTASEITEDPKHCAREAVNVLLRRSVLRGRDAE